MFPHTQRVDLFPCCVDIHGIVSSHVETVCLLSKRSETKNHISVKVDMDEMDVTAAESEDSRSPETPKEKLAIQTLHASRETG